MAKASARVLNGPGTADDVIVLNTGDNNGVRNANDLLLANTGQIDLTFGNGLIHTLSHVRWLLEAGVQLDSARVARYEADALRLAKAPGVPQRSQAAETYNIACHHTLRGSLAVARRLLRDAFRMDPELLAFSRTDEDLVVLRDQLDKLGG